MKNIDISKCSKLKTWIIKLGKKQALKQYAKLMFKVKKIIYLLIGVVLMTNYQTYIMEPTMKYVGYWTIYIHMVIVGIALLYAGRYMFKGFMKKETIKSLEEPVEEINNHNKSDNKEVVNKDDETD